MLCAKCRQKEATAHFTIVVDGTEEETIHLCRDCATATGFSLERLDPKEIEAYRVGEKIFYYRGGTHDFACATCHGDEGKRIRLQDLPNLMTAEGAQKAYTTWPAYRVSQGELRTFEWRLYDCFRQQRFPELVFGSDAAIALTMFLARNANGAPFDAPAIKR